MADVFPLIPNDLIDDPMADLAIEAQAALVTAARLFLLLVLVVFVISAAHEATDRISRL